MQRGHIALAVFMRKYDVRENYLPSEPKTPAILCELGTSALNGSLIFEFEC